MAGLPSRVDTRIIRARQPSHRPVGQKANSSTGDIHGTGRLEIEDWKMGEGEGGEKKGAPASGALSLIEQSLMDAILALPRKTLN